MLSDLDAPVGLFPGQGGYRRGALASFWDEGDRILRDVMDEIDQAAQPILGRDLGSRLFGRGEGVEDDPESTQLAVFAISVCTYALARDRGVRFQALLGHSLGEFAALVSAGALTVTQGAQMLCHRIAATTDVTGAGMVSLACGIERATLLLDLVGDTQLVPAVVNGPAQVVVSGPDEGLRRVEQVSRAVGITALRLVAPAPFHSPLMAQVRREVTARLGTVPRGRTLVPVYSPILGRFYRDEDDLVAMLGLHLVTPVRFDAAVDRLYAAGARVFAEVGAGLTLTALVRSAHPDVLVVPALPEAQRPVEPDPKPVGVPVPRIEERADAVADDVLATVRGIYAEALEYPEEVLTPDADLEADLGVDSVKRVELLARVLAHFEIDRQPSGEFPTLGSVVELVGGSLRAGDDARR